MRLPSHAPALPRPSTRTLLLALVLSSTAIGGLQSVHASGHSSPHAHVAAAPSTGGPAAAAHGDSHPAGAGASSLRAAAPHDHPSGGAAAPHDHPAAAAGSADAPRTAHGELDHTAMTIMSGQTDGPSQPTNRVAEPAGATSGAGQAGSPLLHWVRDALLAVPVALGALLLAGGLARRGRRQSQTRLLAIRSLTVSAGLALASPAHGLLFDEGVASLTEMARVFALVLPFVAATLLAVAGAGAAGAALLRCDPRELRKRALVAVTALGVLVGSGSVSGAAMAAPPKAPSGGTKPTDPAPAPAPAPVPAGAVCPTDARPITYELSAFSISIPLNGWGDKLPNGLSYALNGRDARIGKTQMTANPNLTQPIVVRANVGDCITVKLKNDIAGKRVGIHPDGLVQLDPKTSDGARVGNNADTTAAPGSTATYTWYADKQGEAPLSDIANVDANADGGSTVQRGLYGASSCTRRARPGPTRPPATACSTRPPAAPSSRRSTRTSSRRPVPCARTPWC
jgi:hypothetical protein